jgi:hypothetical protein
VIRQNKCSQWDGTSTLNSGNSQLEFSLSTWPASSNQDAHDLSDAGFFHTSAVLYKQITVYYKNKYFLENPTNKKFCYRRKRPQICFHCGVALKDWKVTDSAWLVHAIWSPKCVYALHIKGPSFVSFVARPTK